MKNIVFIENNRPVTDSLTVADVFGKEHRNVLADIENQIRKLIEAGEREWGLLNFQQTQYQHPQNKQWYPKYNLTEDAFAIVVMSYITPEAMKMKVRFLEEFKRMREQIKNNITPIDDRTVRIALLKTAQDHEERLEYTELHLLQINQRVEEIDRKVEEQITLESGEQRKVQKSIARRIYEIESDQKIRNEYFRQLHREIHDRWAVASYKDVRRNELDGLLKYIEAWKPRQIA
ncbi:Rha family transcriptional regulator [Paenibacillus oleatilyticus]|uniref:Rha family transcriptional regulator n=1 Tax=Paenibacillus oleatilyticus TaxID=2594886 RepID=A0ABV4VCB0_9BACL